MSDHDREATDDELDAFVDAMVGVFLTSPNVPGGPQLTTDDKLHAVAYVFGERSDKPDWIPDVIEEDDP